MALDKLLQAYRRLQQPWHYESVGMCNAVIKELWRAGRMSRHQNAITLCESMIRQRCSEFNFDEWLSQEFAPDTKTLQKKITGITSRMAAQSERRSHSRAQATTQAASLGKLGMLLDSYYEQLEKVSGYRK